MNLQKFRAPLSIGTILAAAVSTMEIFTTGGDNISFVKVLFLGPLTGITLYLAVLSWEP